MEAWKEAEAGREGHDPPPSQVPKFFDFMQFLQENLAKSYVGATPPPPENPGSATA